VDLVEVAAHRRQVEEAAAEEVALALAAAPHLRLPRLAVEEEELQNAARDEVIKQKLKLTNYRPKERRRKKKRQPPKRQPKKQKLNDWQKSNEGKNSNPSTRLVSRAAFLL
jgi:hypothetical protein